MIHNFNLMNLIYIKNSFKKLKIYMIEKNKPLPNLLKLAQAVVQNMWFFKILSGFKLVVNCVGCVCRHSSHVRTFLSNSRHKLQVAAFPRLAAAFRGSNTRVYVIAISFTMCEYYPTTHLHQVLFHNRKNRNWNVSIIVTSIRWKCYGSYTVVWLVPSIYRG